MSKIPLQGNGMATISKQFKKWNINQLEPSKPVKPGSISSKTTY